MSSAIILEIGLHNQVGVAVPEMYEHVPAVAEPEYLDSYHRAKKHIEELATFLRPIEKGACIDLPQNACITSPCEKFSSLYQLCCSN